MTGTCMAEKECSENGENADGNCAAGKNIFFVVKKKL